MDKEQERVFLEVYSKALVSLPFDVKVLLEAVAMPTSSMRSASWPPRPWST